MPSEVVRSQAAADALCAWLQTNATNIPMLPEVATRVIALAASPDVTISQLAHVISKDQVLTTRLLSLANSAYYASSVDVTSVPEAIMRVGSTTVRNLAVTLCVTSRMLQSNVYGTQGHALADHGIGAAYLARLIADEAGAEPDQAFLCGLLHDIGKMVILKWHHDHVKRTSAPLAADALADLLREWHPETAVRAFRRWGLPLDLDEPVRYHHDYAAAPGNRRMAAIVYLANRLSHRYAFGCEADGFDPAADPVCTELGLEPEWLAGLDQKAPGLFSVARESMC